MARDYLSDEQVDVLAVQIVKLLHGAPLGQVLRVLKRAHVVVLDGHVVDTSNGRFKSLEQELNLSFPE